MQSQGCTPDVVTYTALISSYEKGGQWQRALAAFNQMRHQRCPPDSIVYNAIIDALWETGVIWAQRQVRHLTRSQCFPPAQRECTSHVCTLLSGRGQESPVGMPLEPKRPRAAVNSCNELQSAA